MANEWAGVLSAAARRELLEGILPFWRRHAPEPSGGFIGEMTNDLRVNPDASKGLILNARILWTFSAAARETGVAEDGELAQRSMAYLRERFRDRENGGYFWELTSGGAPLDTKKKTYGQAFCIYALAEHYRAFGLEASRDEAIALFRILEDRVRDRVHDGYDEVRHADWSPCEDMRLSEKDMNAVKSMNNHLHVLEAYTNLLRIWREPELEQRLGALIDLFQERILDAGGTHFHHFFDADWRPLSHTHTFGHDIEGSWLLYEAAEVLGDTVRLESARRTALKMAEAVLAEGVDDDGGLLYEALGRSIVNADKEWWPQAEAVVGLLNAWQLSGEDRYREAAVRCWGFIQARLVDREHGEWFWKVTRVGVPDRSLPKISIWKCPYHNGRCCLEILHRLRGIGIAGGVGR